MNWSRNLHKLQHGLSLATRIIKAKLEIPAVPSPGSPAGLSRLVEYEGFGENPGRLRMRAHVPPSVHRRPLVVLLHGCGQDGAAFARDTGWTELADRLQFALILPEQTEANNSGRCFRWFQPSDTMRGAGEAASIAAMTRAAIGRLESDPARVFVVGLSAGGAMAVAMLAAYPDLFAAGASIAGLPVGAARSGMQAILRMASAGPNQSPEAWGAQARAAAPAGFAGPRPRLSVWHGQADRTVAPENSELLATQWRALHGLSALTVAGQVHNGVQHRIWPDGKQRKVEHWLLPNLSHAYPIGDRAAVPGHFVEKAPIDATFEIARFFGLD